VIGETAYDDASVASAIKEFEATSTRRILEVMEWPGGPGQSCPPSPPFEANAYLQTLTGARPRLRLIVGVRANRSTLLRTAYGNRVTALEPGRYTLVVNDASRSDNFHLAGPSVNKRTGIRFTGTMRWTVELRPGTYRYRSDRSPSKRSCVSSPAAPLRPSSGRRTAPGIRSCRDGPRPTASPRPRPRQGRLRGGGRDLPLDGGPATTVMCPTGMRPCHRKCCTVPRMRSARRSNGVTTRPLGR
jgi:hypothetical protein